MKSKRKKAKQLRKPLRDFRKGDIVNEFGSNIRAVVEAVKKEVVQIKIRILEGEDEGKEEWVDVVDYDFYYEEENASTKNS
jgi:hypothetical protein